MLRKIPGIELRVYQRVRRCVRGCVRGCVHFLGHALLPALVITGTTAARADDGTAAWLSGAAPAAERADVLVIPLTQPSITYLVAAVEVAPQTQQDRPAVRTDAAVPAVMHAAATAAAAIEPLAVNAAQARADTLALKTDAQLLVQRPGADAVPAFFQGLKISGETGRVTVIEGDAELRKRGTNIKADRITYQQVEDQLQAVGDVRIYREGDIFTGTSLDLKLDAHTGTFLKSTYLLANDRARGSAGRMEFLGHDQYRADDAVYTTCGPGNDDWYLKVSELKLDYGRDTGEVSNAQLNFLGMHILSVPGMSFALNARRKSGFLAPSFGSTTSGGQELSTPYYWNMAPNRDLTVTPRYMTKRGLQTNLAGRFIGENYQGEARVEWLPDDKVTRTNRNGFSLLHRHVLGGGWSGNLNLNRVSDDTYFTDLSSRITATSQRTLVREGALNYSSPYFGVGTRVQSYQLLQDPVTPLIAPYHRVPQINLGARRYDVAGFDLNFAGEFARFTHPTQVMGNRLIANPSISYPLLSPGAYITPKLALHSTRYLLQQTASGEPDSFLRTVPSLSVDGGLVFERPAALFGNSYTQTLEPRMMYVRVPVREQSRLPVFDSGLADFNFAQVFADNIYSGADRIADASQVTVGVTSRLLGTDKAGERIRVSLAQRYYFANQTVTLPGETARTDRTSDFLAALSGEIAPKLLLDTALQYNPSSGAAQRATIGVRWTPELAKTISAAYRFRRDSIEQVDFAAQWKFDAHWYGVGRYNYSIRDNKVVEALAGFEYDGGCWVGRFVLQRFATTAQQSTTALFFQIELNGLSRLGSNPLDVLRRNIPGYSKLNEHQQPGSRTMDRYE